MRGGIRSAICIASMTESSPLQKPIHTHRHTHISPSAPAYISLAASSKVSAASNDAVASSDNQPLKGYTTIIPVQLIKLECNLDEKDKAEKGDDV